ncbi:MAG: TauD/TfdA dioxygenase family protein [Novosphingobium sp.]
MHQPRQYTLPGGLTVTRTQPAIGAVVSGVDLAQPLSEAHAADLRAALFAHGVIFLQEQGHIGFDEHLELARAYGTPITDGPDPERPMITPVKAAAFKREGTASSWHSDGCYMASPPSVSILRAIEPCSFGGDTLWASGVAAYAGLPDDMREQVDGLTFYTCLAERMPKDNDSFGTSEKWNQLRAAYPPIHQPVVVVHPVTGARSLYANSTWSISIDGLEEAESRALIDRLTLEYMRPEYQTRWNWSKGDIAIWDNRIVLHYGVPDQTTDRYLERITVQGGPMLSIADWESKQAGRKAA